MTKQKEKYNQRKMESQKYWILAYFILICFAKVEGFCCCCCCFLQMEDLWQSCMEQVYACLFFNIICSLSVSVSHFGNSHNFSIILLLLLLLLYLLWWSITSNFKCYYCNCLGLHQPFSCKTVNFKTRDMFLGIATSLFFISLSPLRTP